MKKITNTSPWNKKRFLFLPCIAGSIVLFTPLASFAAGTTTFLSPIEIKQGFNITQIAQSLTALALLSTFLERAIEIVFGVFDIEKSKINEQQRRKLIPFATLLIGLGISAVGIRGLEPFFTLTSDSQVNLFRLIDIVLTGTLISGGTAGIHEILTSLTAFLDVTKASAKAEKAEHELKKEESEKTLKTLRSQEK